MPIARAAHAKVNLFLRIAGRRADGYHEIETLFQRISLADRLTFAPSGDGALTLAVRGIAVPGAADENLVVRAAEALRMRAPFGAKPGARIVLDKRIPTGGGLGGGSSDAAATLLALREAWRLGVNDGELAALARRLGADVPFFLTGASRAIGRGVGERLTAVPRAAAQAEPFHVVLALPPYGVPTAEVYRRYDPVRPEPCEPGRLDRLVASLTSGDLDATLAALWNEMEPLAFAIRPELGALRARLEGLARRPVRMSGSGSTLFTLAANDGDAKRLAEAWQAEAVVARTERLL